MQVVIKSIARNYLIPTNDYKWLLSHLDTPLYVMGLYYDNPKHGGNLWLMSVFTDTSVISIYVKETEAIYELISD